VSEVRIYPADGWVLVARDFGTETLEVTMPYFLLYNKYRGILRLFFYYALQQPYSYGLVQLKAQDTAKPAALFTFGASRYALDDFDPILSQEVIVTLGYTGWGYADFVILGYDPAIPIDATLTFTFRGVDETELEASGTLTLEQVGLRANLSVERDYVDAFTTAYKNYKDADSGLTDLKEELENDDGGFLKTYLLPHLDSPLVDAVPYLSAAAGFVKALIGGKPNQVLPMKFEGGVQLSGELTTMQHLHNIILRVPGAPLSNPNDNARPLYTQPLGIFNLAKLPVLVTHQYQECVVNTHIEDQEFCSDDIDVYFEEPLQVVINPALNDAAVAVKAGMVLTNQEVTYSTTSSFSAYTSHFYFARAEDTEVPVRDKMALKVTVTPYNGSYGNDPIVITTNYVIKQKVEYVVDYTYID
jgi:hypothetical protein